MTTASIPQAYVVGSSPRARTVLASARTAIAIAIGLWPLTATVLAVGAMLFSH